MSGMLILMGLLALLIALDLAALRWAIDTRDGATGYDMYWRRRGTCGE